MTIAFDLRLRRNTDASEEEEEEEYEEEKVGGLGNDDSRIFQAVCHSPRTSQVNQPPPQQQ